jgi:hypothetical protein
MSESETDYEITDETEFEIIEGKLTEEEKQWLRSNGVLDLKGWKTESGEVSSAELNVNELARIAFEFDILSDIASSVETDVMEVFRRNSSEVLTTAQVADETGRPKSSISRALTRLVEKNKLYRIQSGVYRLH